MESYLVAQGNQYAEIVERAGRYTRAVSAAEIKDKTTSVLKDAVNALRERYQPIDIFGFVNIAVSFLSS